MRTNEVYEYMNNDDENQKLLLEDLNSFEEMQTDCLDAISVYNVNVLYDVIYITVQRESLNGFDIVGTYEVMINDIVEKNGKYYMDNAINDYSNNFQYDVNMYFNDVLIQDVMINMHEYGIYNKNTNIEIRMSGIFFDTIISNVIFNFPRASIIDNITFVYEIDFDDLVQIDINKYKLRDDYETILFVRDIRERIENQINNPNIYDMIVITITQSTISVEFYNNDNDNNTSLNGYIIFELIINALNVNGTNRLKENTRDITNIFLLDELSINVNILPITMNIYMVDDYNCKKKTKVTSIVLEYYELSTRTPEYYMRIAKDEIYTHINCNQCVQYNSDTNINTNNIIVNKYSFMVDDYLVKHDEYTKYLIDIRELNQNSTYSIYINKSYIMMTYKNDNMQVNYC
jgi:hypothetical protein